MGKALQKLGLKALEVKIVNDLEQDITVFFGVLPRPEPTDPPSPWWQKTTVAPGMKFKTSCGEQGVVVTVKVERKGGHFIPYSNRQLYAANGFKLTVRKEKLTQDCWRSDDKSSVIKEEACPACAHPVFLAEVC